MPEMSNELHAVHVYDVKATVSLLLDRLLQHKLDRVEITVAWPEPPHKNLMHVELGIKVWK